MSYNYFTILHLSDFHFRGGQDFDRSVVMDPLLKRLSLDARTGIIPQIIIISGDIAFSGKPEEYTSAQVFLTRLLATCNLSKDRLFLVPGNHDIDRKAYRPSDCPVEAGNKRII